MNNTPAAQSIRTILAAARRSIRNGGRPAEDTPLAGYDEYLAIRRQPASGGGWLIGCYRYRIECHGEPVTRRRSL